MMRTEKNVPVPDPAGPDRRQSPLTDLRSLSLEQLTGEITGAGYPGFRAAQLYHWLHVRLARDYEEMTNLPRELKNWLREHYALGSLRMIRRQVSGTDGTQKFLFGLSDGETVESVYMRYRFGGSVCVSSQVGCRMGCRFCASALDGLVRDLQPGEMLEEVYAICRALTEQYRAPDGHPANGHGAPERAGISHVVLMGTGEPLDNYDNVVRFLRMLTDGNGLHLSVRGITVSTCGIVPRIYELAGEKLPVTLALSLHAGTDERRREIMPVANRYSIDECIAACRYYSERTGRRISFEYSLIRGMNDSAEDADQLALLAHRVRSDTCPAAHINLIPVNPVEECGCLPPDLSAVRAFAAKLEKHRINVSIRRVLGRDIDGACGQLRHRHQEGREYTG